jgi:hypothetical protein
VAKNEKIPTIHPTHHGFLLLPGRISTENHDLKKVRHEKGRDEGDGENIRPKIPIS